MAFREQQLGRVVRFLLPSLKLKQAADEGGTVEQQVHTCLTRVFGGYTATSGNLFGYWKDDSGHDQYGEHRQFSIGLEDEARLEDLKGFLARLAQQIDEECLYVEVGGQAILVYADRQPPE